MPKLQADREILYRGLNLPKVEVKTDNHVILLPGANPLHFQLGLGKENK